ncbi:MAG: sugar ABC transporter permease, partial [Pyrinomonadaceae bacterium]
MSETNLPGGDRPPATSDFAPVPVTLEAEELIPQTTIGKFKIPTDVLRAYTMVFALIAIWIYFHYSTDQIFLDPRNFSNLMRQTAVTGVLAVGMLMVIITAQIDLSVGSVVGLAGGIAAISQGWWGLGLVPSLAVGVAVALAIGAMQGSLVAYLNIPAFIVTLGGLLAWRGVILGLSRGETIPIRLQAFKAIGQNYVDPRIGWLLAGLTVVAVIWLNIARNRARRRHQLAVPSTASTLIRIVLPAAVILWFIYMMNTYEGIPIPVIILIAIALAGAFLTQNTTFGRYL